MDQHYNEAPDTLSSRESAFDVTDESVPSGE